VPETLKKWPFMQMLSDKWPKISEKVEKLPQLQKTDTTVMGVYCRK